MTVRVLTGDSRDVLRTLSDGSVQCIVTSPPYYGLRSYLPDDHPAKAMEMGHEQTPDEYVAGMVDLFREARRVLRDDGVLWLNLGDSYAGSGRGGNPPGSTSKQDRNAGSVAVGDYAGKHAGIVESGAIGRKWVKPPDGLKRKDLIGIPFRVAFALQADGWYWRQCLPWVKRNPMPESTRDRPTTAVEYVFLFSKSATYFYDYNAVKQQMAPSSLPRLAQDIEKQAGSLRANGGAKGSPMKAVRGDKQRGHSRRDAGFNDRWDQAEREDSPAERAFRNSDLFFASIDSPHGAVGSDDEIIALDVSTQPFKGAHFATFPPKLIEPLILAGCPRGGVVLDPFFGAGTTGLVADRMGRDCIGIELFGANSEMASGRIQADSRLLSDVRVEVMP